MVNAAPSISGRYPNLGPQLLVEAGIPLVDDVGADVFEQVSDGQRVRLDGETLYLGEEVVAKGTVQDSESVATAMDDAKVGLADQLKAFAANTIEYISRDSELLIDGHPGARAAHDVEGKHVLVVARGYRHRDDLQALRAYIREFKPVMMAVDGGANALLEAGYKPDLIVGDMDSVSDKALDCGAELVVHAYRNGVAPGLARVQDLGLASVLCPATGTSEDLAVLLADEMGADPDRGRGHALLDGRIPRQGPVRDGQRGADPDEGRRQDRRRQGRQQALPEPDLRVGPVHPGAGGLRRRCSRPRSISEPIKVFVGFLLAQWDAFRSTG